MSQSRQPRSALHGWRLDPAEARALQIELADRVRTQWEGGAVRSVAGIDVSYRRGKSHAAIVVLSYPGLSVLQEARASIPTEFPYVPGLLSFREAPAVLAAWEKIRVQPDLLMFDAHGLAHPRRFGLASHLGLWLDIPSIGVAKSKLIGEFTEPGLERGDRSQLSAPKEPDELLGTVLRTRDNVRPLFVSIGHRIDLRRSVEYVLACGAGYRLPEPTRLADKLAGS